MSILKNIFLSVIIILALSTFGYAMINQSQKNERNCLQENHFCINDYQYTAGLKDVLFIKTKSNIGYCFVLQAKFKPGKEAESATYCDVGELYNMSWYNITFQKPKIYGNIVRRDFQIPKGHKYLYCALLSIETENLNYIKCQDTPIGI